MTLPNLREAKTFHAATLIPHAQEPRSRHEHSANVHVLVSADGQLIGLPTLPNGGIRQPHRLGQQGASQRYTLAN